MFSRYFWAFCLVVLMAVAVSAQAQEAENRYEDSSIEIADRSKIGKKVEKILKSFFKHVTEDCLKSAVDKCKKHWYNPSKVIKCAEDFFSIENAGCLVGARISIQEENDSEYEDDSSLSTVEDSEIIERSKIGRKIEKILKKFFKHITHDCLKSAVKKCKKHWYNPAKVIRCAKDFFSIENAGCLVGARMSDLTEEDSEDFESYSSLESVEESEIAERSKIGKTVEKILKKFFKNITGDCLKSAVDKCKKHWYNPSKVIQCAKDFFSIENAGCLVGARISDQDQEEDDYMYDDESDLDVVEDSEIIERSKIGRKIEKILKKFFKHIAEDCLKSAVKKCKKHWYNPAKVIRCAKDFFSIENAGCLVGARMSDQQIDDSVYVDDSSFNAFEENEIAERNKIGKTVEKILKKFFKNITGDCLKSAVSKCKKHWYNPSKVIQCAKDFFSIENAGCLVGA